MRKKIMTNNGILFDSGIDVVMEKEEFKMTKKQARKELKSILKDYHYDSKTEQMSKDVVTALENLVDYLK